jgi:hypothetical protein
VNTTGDDDNAARGLKLGQQFVDEQKVTEVVDGERRFEAVGCNRFGPERIHAGVAHHRMQRRHVPLLSLLVSSAAKARTDASDATSSAIASTWPTLSPLPS